MKKNDKGKIIDLTDKYIQLTYEKLFGEKATEEVDQQLEQKRQTVEEEFRETQTILAKEEMMAALTRWNGYMIDEFVRFQSKVSDEIKNFPSSYDQFSENQKNYVDKLLALHAVSIAIRTLREDGRNWKELIQNQKTGRK